ncbi:MAG TPA: GlxA family transcriptional regulator [Amycolatopsis sp.]|nr:GlxA family transcriptional regulator [Amycolatopsis sp.]
MPYPGELTGPLSSTDAPTSIQTVAILVYDGVTLIDVAGPADVFAHANRVHKRYDVVFVSADGRPVTSSTGLRLHADATINIDGVHTVFVPGAYGLTDKPFDPAQVDAVRVLTAGATRIAALCTGSFLLAETGLLAGRKATTHWRQIPRFTRAHPDIVVEPDALYVRDGSITTAAGISSGIDVALALVRDDLGAECASAVAEAMVVFMPRPGRFSQFSAPSRQHIGQDHPLRRVVDAIAADPGADHSVPVMAGVASVSTRQLTRLFHDEIGTTPARYVELVRLENAQAMLQSGHTVEAAARRSGFGSADTLRRVFSTRLGLTPTAYRDQHAAAHRTQS